MMKNILAVTLTEITNDNRVINYTNALAANGQTVILISPEPKARSTSYYQFSTIYLPLFINKFKHSFVLGVFKLFEFLFRAVVSSKKINCDIIHAHDLKGLLVASSIKRLVHKKALIVYDAHEYETESNGLKGVHKQVLEFLERRLIKNVSRVITVSDSIADEYVRLYGIKNPTVLLNVPKAKRDKNEKYDLFREKFGIRIDQRIFLYQGYLGRGRGIEILLNTFTKLVSDKNVIVFMGRGPLEHIIHSFQQGKNIYFHDYVHPNEFLNYTSSADIGLVLVEDTCLSYRYCLPNKLFEYIFSGLPVICSNLPEMKKLVLSNEVGIVASENTEKGFMDAINFLNAQDIDFFKANTLATSEKYSWSNQEEKLIRLYDQL